MTGSASNNRPLWYSRFHQGLEFLPEGELDMVLSGIAGILEIFDYSR